MSYDDEKFEPTQEIVFEEDDVIEDFDFPEEMDEDIVIEDDMEDDRIELDEDDYEAGYEDATRRARAEARKESDKNPGGEHSRGQSSWGPIRKQK